jgi:hypothetical protein
MSIELIKRLGKILLVLLALLGVYHILIYFYNKEIIDIDLKYIYGLYYLSQNFIVISLLAFIYKIMKPLQGIRKIYRKFPIPISIYFIYKIILNILFLFEGFKSLLVKYEIDHNIWSFSLVGVIIVIFLIIKRYR